MPSWLSEIVANRSHLLQVVACVLALLNLVLLVLLMVEVRMTRNTLGSRVDVLSERLAAISRILLDDGPIRYALAGMIVVKQGQKRSTAELRHALQEVLDEWGKADQIAAELRDSLERLDARSDHRESSTPAQGDTSAGRG